MSNERLEVLGGLPLFEPLSPDERERLAAGCRMRTFARGAALFREGERADGMHIVLRGVVKVVRFAPDGRRWCFILSVRETRSARPQCSRRGRSPRPPWP